jgi:hypothetical protein
LALPAAPPLTKSSSIRSFLGLSAQQQSDTQAADDTAAGGSSNNGGRDSSCGSSAPGSTAPGCSSSSGQTLAEISEAQGAMLLSAGLDGRVIQWDLAGERPAAVQSVLACAGAVVGSELTAMTYLQGAAITVTGECVMQR